MNNSSQSTVNTSLWSQRSLTKIPKPQVKSVAWLMCALGTIFYCYEYYLRIAPSVMGSELREVYQVSEAALGHLSACFYYAYVMMQVPVGVLLDKFGPRRVLTVACFLCALGTYLFAGTDSFILSQLGRFLVGFGSAFAYVGVLKLADIWLAPRYFALMAGICTTLGLLGAMTGQIWMTSWVEAIGWQKLCYYAAWIGLFLTALLWLGLKNKQAADLPQVQHPTLPMVGCLTGMLKSPQLWLTGFLGCLTFLPVSLLAELWGISFLEARGLERQTAAVASSMVFLGFAMGGPVWGLLSDKLQSRKIPMMIGSLFAAIAASILIWLPDLSVYALNFTLLLLGFFTSAEVLVFAISNDMSDSRITATAAAFTNMLVMMGGAILQPVVGMLLDHLTNPLETALLPTAAHYATALSVLPISLLIAAVLSLFLRETYPRPRA